MQTSAGARPPSRPIAAAAPPAAPAALNEVPAPSPEPALQRAVEIRIGRVEIHAAPAPAPAAAPAASPGLSLDAFLGRPRRR